MDQKTFVSAISKNRSWREAVKELTAKVKKDMGGKTCDLVVFFVSEVYDHFDTQAFSRLLTDLLPCRVLVGCN